MLHYVLMSENPFTPVPLAGPDVSGAPTHMPRPVAQQALSTYSQKVIEEKERELQNLVLQNYNRIRDVQRELTQLQLQVQLTAGPKKQALELIRKKIEIQNEKVVAVRQRHSIAKQAFLAVEEELKKEEEEKDKLCEELQLLIQQSTSLQLQKMEELKQHLEMLNHGMAPAEMHAAQLRPPHPVAAGCTAGTAVTQAAALRSADGAGPALAAISSSSDTGAANGTAPKPQSNGGVRAALPSQQQQAKSAEEEAAAAAAAAAARTRHVSIGNSKPQEQQDQQQHAQQQQQRGTRPPAKGRPGPAALPSSQSDSGRHQRLSGQPFSGFDT